MPSASSTSPPRCILFDPMDLYTCNYELLTPFSPTASSTSPWNSATRRRDIGGLHRNLASKDQDKEGTRYFQLLFATRSPNPFRSRSTLYLIFLLVHCRYRRASSYLSHPTLQFQLQLCSGFFLIPPTGVQFLMLGNIWKRAITMVTTNYFLPCKDCLSRMGLFRMA